MSLAKTATTLLVLTTTLLADSAMALDGKYFYLIQKSVPDDPPWQALNQNNLT